MALLDIRNLSVTYHTPRGPVQAVDHVSLNVEQAQHLGIIGESGCGKTTLIRALVRVLRWSSLQLMPFICTSTSRPATMMKPSSMTGGMASLIRWLNL